MASRSDPAVRERLDRATIATDALALADREGLDAVTIRRLAAEHSVTPMALYWHFKDKDAVLDAVAEQVYRSVRARDADSASWETELRDVLNAVLDAIRPHPLVADLLAARVMKSEAGLLLAERVIGLLRTGGFSAGGAAETSSLLLCSIVALVTSKPGSTTSVSDDASAELRSKRAQLDSLDPERFPNLLESAEFFVDCTDDSRYYSLGIEFLVHGVTGILPA